MADRDTLKRGRRLRPVSGSQTSKLIFRDLFIEEKDAQIAKIVSITSMPLLNVGLQHGILKEREMY